jgi:plastocyanin
MRRLLLIVVTAGLCCWATAAIAATRSITATESDGVGYSVSKLKAKPGKVTIQMTNPSTLSLDHSVAIKGNGVSVKGPIVAPGGTSSVTATLKKGKYTFYCHVKGHAADGMKGTLKVK